MQELEHIIIGDKGPTLVIEIGIGNSYYQWLPFLELIKGDYKIVIYHRGGYGKSKIPNQSRTVSNIAKELDILLEKLHINEKFILLGHSFGGLCVQQYAKMYPEKISGIILVDATSHNFQRLYELSLPVMYSLVSLEQMIEGNIQSSQKSKSELYDTFSEMIEENKRILPKKYHKGVEEFFTSQSLFLSIADEFKNWERSSQLIKNSGQFPNLPLFVLARDKELAATPFIEHGIPAAEAHLHEEVWRELQIELSQLSKRGELIIADGSDHEIHKDRPDLLAQSIEKLRHKYIHTH